MAENNDNGSNHPVDHDAQRIIDRYVRWSFAAGLIPAPLIDIAAITGIQLKMITELSEHYDAPFQVGAGRKVVTALMGSIAPTYLTLGQVGSFIKALPLIGPITGALTLPTFAAISTTVVGNTFAAYFATGQDLLSLDLDREKRYFEHKFKEAKRDYEDRKSAGGAKAKPATA